MNWRLAIYPEAGSTQDLTKGLALEGEPEGGAVMALCQTAGRGRMGRSWQSGEAKDLALSFLLRPSIPACHAPLLGLLTAIAVARTVGRVTAASAQVRWPNDVLLNGKKVAGILSEGMVQGDEIRYVIVGVGLNVNSVEHDFFEEFRARATSLAIATGQRFDLVAVARTLLDEFGPLYDRMGTEGVGFVVPLWETLWAHRGTVLERDGVSGVADGVNPDGSLRLRTGDGRLITISSGEVAPARPLCEDASGAG